ncbi:uncharacterized protein LOC142989353 [Genypterus blacodes]|uniref:uncharacterized protein LOC142989353 n=1 Tax=Genypterus blacodes TaxID=154954 RepID=UPI003F76A873
MSGEKLRALLDVLVTESSAVIEQREGPRERRLLATHRSTDIQRGDEDDLQPHIKEEEWLGEDEEKAVARLRKTQRVSAAAQQIAFLFERTIAEYEGCVSCLREENERQARLLDAILKPRVQLHRADVQQCFLNVDRDEAVPPHIKEEDEEPWTHRELDEESDITAFTFTPGKSKNDNEDTPGPEPGSHLQPLSEDEELESETETAKSDEQMSLLHEHSRVSGDAATSLSCFVCRKSFARKDSLQRHMRNHTGETPYSCSVCRRSFRQRESLMAHISCHSEERPFSCSICQKRFKLSQTATRHMKSHAGEKPFSCSVCGNAFARKENLIGHMRLHSGEKPFSCKVCHKRFRWRQNILSHMRVHTGEKPYRCSICAKQFKNKNYMIKHTQTHLAAFKAQ